MPSTDISLSTTTRGQVANVVDALFLLLVDFLLLELTALVAGVRSTEVLRAAAPAMIALFALIAALYFVCSGGWPGLRSARRSRTRLSIQQWSRVS